MPDAWCTICERDLAAIPAEVRALYGGVCVQCWIESVEEGINAVDELPADVRPLVRRV